MMRNLFWTISVFSSNNSDIRPMRSKNIIRFCPSEKKSFVGSKYTSIFSKIALITILWEAWIVNLSFIWLWRSTFFPGWEKRGNYVLYTTAWARIKYGWGIRDTTKGINWYSCLICSSQPEVIAHLFFTLSHSLLRITPCMNEGMCTLWWILILVSYGEASKYDKLILCGASGLFSQVS